MAKINITMNDDLLEKVDTCADDLYTSRSGLITIACANYIHSLEMQELIKTMAVAVQKIADQGTVDEETQETINDIERLAKLFASSK